MLERVISGGQTGADLAGWRAARAAGIATGGWMPRGFWTEAGERPEFAELYGAAAIDLPELVVSGCQTITSALPGVAMGPDRVVPFGQHRSRLQTDPRLLFRRHLV